MKIIYIANIRFPTERAHGLQVAYMCRYFADLGIELELWVPARRNHLKADPFSYYGLKENFAVRRFWCLDLLFLSPFIPKIFFHLATKTFARSVYFALKKTHYDVIYSRDWLMARELLSRDLPVFWEVHTLPEKFSEADWQILQKSAGLIAISRSLKNQLVLHGIPEDKVIVAPDGVDLEPFANLPSQIEARKELGLPLDRKIIMYTGHLYEWKGASTLLCTAAFEGFRDRVVLVFIGGMEKDVRKFRRKSGIGPNVLILGHKPHAEIPRYLRAADILVLPNSGTTEISRRHTSPLKLFEYLASGKPIIASDLPSLREILDENSAIFFVADDSESLRDAILKALHNPELCAKMTRHNWDKVQEFTWDKRAKRILDFAAKHHGAFSHHSRS